MCYEERCTHMSEDFSSFEVLGVQMLRLLEQTDCDTSLVAPVCYGEVVARVRPC